MLVLYIKKDREKNLTARKHIEEIFVSRVSSRREVPLICKIIPESRKISTRIRKNKMDSDALFPFFCLKRKLYNIGRYLLKSRKLRNSWDRSEKLKSAEHLSCFPIEINEVLVGIHHAGAPPPPPENIFHAR